MSHLISPQPEAVVNVGSKAGGDVITLSNPGSLYICEWTGSDGQYLNILGNGLLVPYRIAVRSNGTRYRFAVANQHRYVRVSAEVNVYGRLWEGIGQRVAPDGLYDLYEVWMTNTTPFKTYYVAPLRLYFNTDNIGIPVEVFE